ncbi:hypothetical protein [Streptomyces ipomoeae]|uniref:hypothetical protein n=1 Tax=Streptomyces ipomoeae TaxID=103232 RepID=UPI001147717D|nr:hypothetical protein [Streptomyces ipomoeae]TQE33167.1 hypothetical protein Sipo7851_21995 [Streptomyces ipomoeae]
MTRADKLRAAVVAVLGRVDPALEQLMELIHSERRRTWDRAYTAGRDRARKSTERHVRYLENWLEELFTERDPEGLRRRIRNLEAAWDELWAGHTGRRDLNTITREQAARAVEAEERLAAVRNLHAPDDAGLCRQCRVPAPCPTAEVLAAPSGVREPA